MKNLLIVLLLVIGCGLLAYADIVHLKNGNTVEGKVVASNATTVMVQDEFGGIVNVPKNSIQEIETNSVGSSNTVKPIDSNRTNAGKERGRAQTKPQTGDNFDESARNVIYVGGGFVSFGYGAMASVTAGYEYYLLPNISAGVFLSIWPGTYAVAAIYDVTCNIHFIGKKSFDPYIGIGIANMAVSTSSKTYFDFPVSLGINFWFNNNFGIKVQDKLYLLSIAEGMNELTAQLVFAF